MKLLAIDTATEMCSVALQIGDELLSRQAIAPRSHTELILPMVDEVLTQAGCTLTALDALVYDRGPGAFTGLRIGTGVVQGLALGAGLPVIEISSLAALAQEAYQLDQAQTVLACIDARKAEVYWGCYAAQHGLMQLLGEEHVGPANAVAPPMTGLCYGVGTGFDAYAAELAANANVRLSGYAGQRYPLARYLLPLAIAAWAAGKAIAPQAAQPVYLRNDVATVKVT